MFFPRKITSAINKALEGTDIIFLLGTRRTGKTTLAKHLLKTYPLPDGQKHYLDLEFTQSAAVLDKASNSPDTMKLAFNLLGIDLSKANFIVLDEIQNLSDPSKLLKLLHDHYPNIKVLATGSSSLQIKSKFTDSLAGRKRVFVLHPLDFDEFLLFKGQDQLIQLRQNFNLQKIEQYKTLIDVVHDQMIMLLEEYLIYGGYPEVVLTGKPEDKIQCLKNIVTSYIEKDISSLANIANTASFNEFLKYLSINTGELFNLSNIAGSLGLSVQTIKKYLFILEQTYIIKQLPAFFTNKNLEIVKNKKIYFFDTGLRNLLIINFLPADSRPDKGQLYETYTFRQIIENLKVTESLYFYRTKHQAEIDFLTLNQDTVRLIEVKAGKFVNLPRAILEFQKRYNNKFTSINSMVVNSEHLGQRQGIIYLPAYLFAYEP